MTVCAARLVARGGAVSFKRRIRTILACLVLQTGVAIGVPMRAEHIEELLRALNQPTLAQTDPERAEQGDP